MVSTVRCVCGTVATVDVTLFGRPLLCTVCRGRFVITWGIDPKSKKAAPVAFEASPDSPRGFKLPMGMFELPCPCGQRLYARPRQAGKRVQCPVCATWMKIEHGRDPQTLETRIRVVKSRLNQLPGVPPEAAPKADGSVQHVLCSCGESLLVDSRDPGSQARCPACGTHMRIEISPGSEGLFVVVDPGSADPAPSVEKRGIDEELSLDDFT